MANTISFGGLVSGLDTNSIIDQLTAVSSRPITNLQDQKKLLTDKVGAWQSLGLHLLDLKVNVGVLNSKISSKANRLVNSSDTNLVTADVIGLPDIGSVSVTVNKLAQSQQSLSQGFFATDKKIIGTGTLNLTAGNNTDDHDITQLTKLSFLNNGTGIAAGSISITDRSGATASINLSGAKTVQDVVNSINNTHGIKVVATINPKGNGISLLDQTGKTTNGLIVQEVAGGTTAQSLGIKTSAIGVSSTRIDGTDLTPAYTVQIDSTNNTLEGIRDAINKIGGPFTAAIINTGAATNPYKLSIVNKNSGAIGGIAFSGSNETITNELVGNGDGTGGATLGDYSLAVSTIPSLSNVSSITVAGQNYAVTKIGDHTNTGNQVEVDPVTGKLQFFVNGAASNVTGEIRATYEPSHFTFSQIRSAQDAEISLGDKNSAQTIKSHSNVVTNVVPGLSLNLIGADTGTAVQINVSADINDLADSMGKFIDAYNTVINDFKTQNTYDSTLKQPGGPLFGETSLLSIVNSLRLSVQNSVAGLSTDSNSVFQLGVKPGVQGNLTFDKNIFIQKATDDFDGVKKILSNVTNMARENATTANASSTADGYNIADIKDGDTSSSNFGPGHGWLSAAGGTQYVTLKFNSVRYLGNLNISTVDSDTLPAASWGIKDYDVQYLKPGGDANKDSDWVTKTAVRSNTTGSIVHALNVSTQQVRLKLIASNAADGFYRLTELEATEGNGVAAYTQNILAGATDATNGIVTYETKGLNDSIKNIDDRIKVLQDRVSHQADILRFQFSQMEQIMARLQQGSSVLSGLAGYNLSAASQGKARTNG